MVDGFQSLTMSHQPSAISHQPFEGGVFMRLHGSMLAAGLAVAAMYAIGNPWIAAQPRGGAAQTRVAAVPGVKGGQDMYGPYESVAGWPKDLSTLPGHEGWTF